MSNRSCLIPSCKQPARTRDMCNLHYQRWWNTGKPSLLTWNGLPPGQNLAVVEARSVAATVKRMRQADPGRAERFEVALTRLREARRAA